VSYEVFAVQPLAEVVLFTPGTVVDQIFAFTGKAAEQYSTEYYFNKGSGRFQSNYFKADLERRGLINSNVGPELKHFPFFDDASRIHDAQEGFMTSFVNSYYKDDSVVSKDKEIKAWAKEANGPAKAIDFPKEITSRKQLVDILTHFVSTLRHTTVHPLTPY